MFKKAHDWKRWSGKRDDIIEACNLASSELEKWNNFPSHIDIQIEYNHNLEHTNVTLEQFEQLHDSDLLEIETLAIQISANTGLHREKREEYQKYKYELKSGLKVDGISTIVEPPDLEYGIKVALIFRAWSHSKGANLYVDGPDRTRVEGLTSAIVKILGRSFSGFRRIRGGSNGLALFNGAVIGYWIGEATLFIYKRISNIKYTDLQDLLIPIFSAFFFGWLVWTVWRSMPTLEILETNSDSKFSKMKGKLISWPTAIIAGVFASAIYAFLFM